MLLLVAGTVFYRVLDKENKESKKKDFGVWEPRLKAAFKPFNCEPKAQAELYSSYYQGPLIDTHFHSPSLPDSDPGSNEDYSREKHTLLGVNITMPEIICMFKNDNTTPRGILAFFPVFPQIYKPAIEVARRTTEEYPGIFVPFINPPDGDNHPHGSQTVDAEKLDEMLSVYPGLFKGYGEIGLYHHKGGAKALSPDSPRLQKIYDVLRKHGIKKIFFHLGEGQKDSFDKTLKTNRDLTFIFHGDQLITQQPDGTQDISLIDELLTDNPNVAYGIDELWGDVFLLHENGSKQEVLNHFKDYEPLLKKDKATWKWFIEKHPDQVMWDTDRGTYLWPMDLEVGQALVNYGRAFIATLDPAVQEKYAYKNAERILSD